jgi:hypothetical protein
MVTAREVAEQLGREAQTTMAKPVEVTLPGEGTRRVGARVAQVRAVPQGSRAWSEGQRTYTQVGLYVLRELPDSYDPDESPVYEASNGGRWYVAGHWQGEPTEPYHPFGSWFILHPTREGAAAGCVVLPMTVREAL